MSCEPISQAFKQCLLNSTCVQRDGRLPSDCAKNHADELPEECTMLRYALFNCKRNMLDMRKRFRGNGAKAYEGYEAKAATVEPVESQAHRQ
ncbi:cytochrome c oxidase assembly protein PET191-domain-containing protein [Auriculariales sp. MPI-PUGE-AT-0066]|nr:cytochrome c oxidase assembly protein PET191-domain-containing protein [Auriculariales sp. MPI-PUGE-AT-0066]